MNARKEAQRYHLEQCPMLSPCGSQGYNIQTIEPMAHSLHPARVLLSLAVLDYKEPHPWIKLYSIPASGHSWLPRVLFQYKNPRGLCKGDFCLFCVTWSSREKHPSRNLVSCEEIWICQWNSSLPPILCPVPLTLSSVVANTGQRLLPLICWGNPFWEGPVVVWGLAWPASDTSSLRFRHREKLTLARALCVLAKPAGSQIPRDPGSATRAASGCTPVFRRAWSRDPESSAEPSLHCPHKSPSQLIVRSVPRLLYERESSLFRTESSVSLPNPTGSQVQR